MSLCSSPLLVTQVGGLICEQHQRVVPLRCCGAYKSAPKAPSVRGSFRAVARCTVSGGARSAAVRVSGSGAEQSSTSRLHMQQWQEGGGGGGGGESGKEPCSGRGAGVPSRACGASVHWYRGELACSPLLELEQRAKRAFPLDSEAGAGAGA